MGRRVSALALLLLLAAAGRPAAGTASETAAALLREQAQEVLQNPLYQRDLPRAGGGTGTGSSSAQEARAKKPGLRGWLPALTTAATVSSGLLWLLVIVVGGVILLWLGYELVRWNARRQAGQPWSVPQLGRTSSASSELVSLGQAEEHARAGRYGEAVHVLLLWALQELVRRERSAVRASRTSREVLRHPGLAAAERAALEPLVLAVEHWLFAGQPLELADYDRCRIALGPLEHRPVLPAQAGEAGS